MTRLKVLESFSFSFGHFEYPNNLPKTAFVTPFGHFEYLVVLIILTKAPSIFQTLMNSLLGHLHFVYFYLGDILIFIKNEEKHSDRLRKVLTILKDNKLHARLAKCKFYQRSVGLLGHVISYDSVRPSPDKLIAVKNSPTPKNVKTLQSFLGFVNFYRRFTPGFGRTALPLTKLLTTDAVFDWKSDCRNAFDQVRDCLLR